MNKKGEKGKNMRNKGITLIALVITIVVLLILAGVTIATLTGENGILTQATKAKEETHKAKEDELRRLTALEASTNLENKTIIDKSTGKNLLVTIPAGFAVSQVEGEDTLKDGLVVIDSNGNEFVWIPVNIENYVRVDFGIQAGFYSTYHEDMSDIERDSIQKYGGYYIGRYESGDLESTQRKTYRNESSNSNNTISIRSGQVPYNYVSREQAILLSSNMKKIQGYSSVNTKICSSYAYDAAVKFISEVEEEFATDTNYGNYGDKSFKYIDIDGEEKEKAEGEKFLVPTGETKDVRNIFDLGGNLWEISSELYSPINQPVTRGGGYGSLSNVYSAGFRNTSQEVVEGFYGFRVCLFVI